MRPKRAQFDLGWTVFVATIASLQGSQGPVSFAQEVFFSDDFESASRNDNLQGYDPFRVSDGVIRMVQDDAPHYLRTRRADYNDHDFVFELSFQATDDQVSCDAFPPCV